jgi:hypothetical protein
MGEIKGNIHLKDLDMYGSVTLRLEGMAWIHLAEDRDRWQTLVTLAINFQIP